MKRAVGRGLSRREPEEMRKVARMLRKHLSNILTYFDSYITNAFSEGINFKIQTIKANTRGW